MEYNGYDQKPISAMTVRLAALFLDKNWSLLSDSIAYLLQLKQLLKSTDDFHI